MNILSPTDYVLLSVLNYPSLYASGSFEKSKIKIFDHFFNTVGNGISDDEEIQECLQPVSFDKEKAMKLANEKDFSYGYKNLITKNWTDSKGNTHSSLWPDPNEDPICVPQSEKENHPEIKEWHDFSNNKMLIYPNFQKKYSTVWQVDFSKYGIEWINAAIEYYTEMQKYFDGDCSSYSYAYPNKNPIEDTELIKGISNSIKNKTNEEISKLYQVEYTGDLDDFLKRRWNIEHTRIKNFIIETIKMLEDSKPGT